MALTITTNVHWRQEASSPGVPPEYIFVSARIGFDSSYPTGGEAIAAGAFGPAASTIVALHVNSSNVATKRAVWDADNNKLMLFVEDGTSGIEAEAANTSDQSGVDDVQVLAILS